jgi:hypothetical protein
VLACNPPLIGIPPTTKDSNCLSHLRTPALIFGMDTLKYCVHCGEVKILNQLNQTFGTFNIKPLRKKVMSRDCAHFLELEKCHK